jgi:16S rRNA (guanine527-N7)-methyltransferase
MSEDAPQISEPTFENDTLPAALARAQIELPAKQVELLDRYCHVLWDWNEKLNLTRHTTYEKFVTRDLVDTLEFSKAIAPDERVLDVGAGGGVPGVVLAILRPDLTVVLSESVGKKARALAAIVSEVGLKARVHAGRAEELLARERFNSLVIRAVAPLPKLLTWFATHWGAFDRLLIIKGPAWVEERKAARDLGLMKKLSLRKKSNWPMPGTYSDSVLLEITPKGAAEG